MFGVWITVNSNDFSAHDVTLLQLDVDWNTNTILHKIIAFSGVVGIEKKYGNRYDEESEVGAYLVEIGSICRIDAKSGRCSGGEN